jgi:dTDP-4-dehydrorhamnose reductase
MTRLKYLITGANGQLAKEFIEELTNRGIKFTALAKEELDISDTNKVFKVIKELKPDIVINCAAYNLVDRAESFPTEAIVVNTLGTANLAFVCGKIKAILVHYSTDYVFDGTKVGFYTEEDQTNPLNEYGKSKLFGELFIQKSLENYLIFRTSWVYGKGTQNFLYKLRGWAEKQEILKIAVDEFSVPTSTRMIIEITLKALDIGLAGLYHITNSGYASRYEWAKEYFKLKGINKLIYPALQADFNLPAKRPKWSAMSNEKISKALGITIGDWKEELKNYCLSS